MDSGAREPRIGSIGRRRRIGQCAGAPVARCTWWIAEKRSAIKAIPYTRKRELAKQLEHVKVSIRAKVEHPFRAIKRPFVHTRNRYRGLVKDIVRR
jgi:hypothetical protein